MRRHRWWHWWRGGYGGLCSTRVLQNETKRYTIHHRVIHVQVHVCLSRPNGKRHDELSSSLLVSREIRDYIRTTMKEVATAHFFKSVSRCHRVSFVVFCHLCYYIVIYILLPPIFCFRRKVAEDFSLLNFFFFFFHKLWFCSTTWEINLFIYFFSF